MTPYELAKYIHSEISTFAPRLSGALNRAFLEFGEGGQPLAKESESFQEIEQINAPWRDFADIMSKIRSVLMVVEENSSWKVIIDKKPNADSDKIELLYTIFRQN